jgi:hypothetical protein
MYGTLPPGPLTKNTIHSNPLHNLAYYPQRRTNPQLPNSTFKLSPNLSLPPVATDCVAGVEGPVNSDAVADVVFVRDAVFGVSFNEVEPEPDPIVVEEVCSCDVIVEGGGSRLVGERSIVEVTVRGGGGDSVGDGAAGVVGVVEVEVINSVVEMQRVDW